MMPKVRFTPPRMRMGADPLKRTIDAIRCCLPPLQLSLPSFDLDLGGGNCGCDIPIPCWWPQPAGEVTSFVCAGGTATLRIRARNVGPRPHDYRFRLDPDPASATVKPDAIQLSPQRTVTAVFSVPTPVNSPEGRDLELIAWVHGCKNYFVRWRIEVTSYAFDSCHEIDIEDRPEYEHHWYDHFYCEHCCRPSRGRG